MIRPPPTSTLFPYTTLFRSNQLRSLMTNPGYSDASFGVVCLFEQQVGLIQDLVAEQVDEELREDRKSTRLNSSHGYISYAVFCLKKKTKYTDGRSTRT